MFSKADFERYCGQLQRLEEEMIVHQERLGAELSDPQVKAVLARLKQDEVRHRSAVERLIAGMRAEGGI